MRISLSKLRPAFVLLLIFGIYLLNQPSGREIRTYDVIGEAFQAGRSDVQVVGEGIVKKVLRDDEKGSRHQRFLLALDSGQTVLIAHNIDLAPRIPDLQRGARVEFKGEYEWNERGGVIHWTHHDPEGRRAGGWLHHDGHRYD